MQIKITRKKIKEILRDARKITIKEMDLRQEARKMTEAEYFTEFWRVRDNAVENLLMFEAKEQARDK